MPQAHVYNLRVVLDWHLRFAPSAVCALVNLFGTQLERIGNAQDSDMAISYLESLPLSPDVTRRLMWKPYLA